MELKLSTIKSADLILITGSNGFLGVKIVETLLDLGFNHLRCFIRPNSNTTRLESILNKFPNAHTDLFSGNLTHREDCERAAREVSLLVHGAAGMSGGFVSMFVDSVVSSRNLLDAVVKRGVIKRILHISSFAVYEAATIRRNVPITENTPLESHHSLRNDPYAYTKHKQEQLFWKYAKEYKLPLVVVRPGVVFGPYGPEISPRVGVDAFGLFLYIGGDNHIPLTYVDNCAEAIVLAATTPNIDGQVYNIHDDDLPTAQIFLRKYTKVKKEIRIVWIPYPVMQVVSRCVKWYSNYSNGQLPPVFNPYKTASIWKGNRFSNAKAKEMLGWAPKVPMQQALESHFEFIRNEYTP